MHIGKVPFTLFTLPSNDNSPINAISSFGIFFITPILHNIPTAIGKSKNAPSFLILAGAKLINTFLLLNSYPEFFIAVRTLSFASLMLVSGNPYNIT